MKRLSCFSPAAVVIVGGLALVGLLLAWCVLTGTSSASSVQPRAGQRGPVAQVLGSSEFPVCTASGDQDAPAIYGDIVVWQDRRGTDGDIYGYDLSTGQEFTVCTASGSQVNPAIYGDIVVWQDERSGLAIYGYDLSTGQEFTVSALGYSPAIYGDIVVWSDWRSGAGVDIYGRRLLGFRVYLPIVMRNHGP
jgi:beta propeller repeat protein